MDETARLEAALARIVRARRPANAPGAAPVGGAGGVELTARLDALIAELRNVLGRDPGD